MLRLNVGNFFTSVCVLILFQKKDIKKEFQPCAVLYILHLKICVKDPFLHKPILNVRKTSFLLFSSQ